MDETNPTDITASPATGPNSAPAISGAAPDIAAAPPAAAVPPILVPSAPPVQTLSQTPTAPAVETGVPSDATEKTIPPVAEVPEPKPLREDIARIIGKIKLPERITLKMSGEQAKPTVLPSPLAVPPTPEKEARGTETLPRPAETPAQAPRQNVGTQEEKPSSVTSVHTLKDDLQKVVHDKKMSLVRAVALESEKKKGQEHLASPHLPADNVRSRKVIGFAFVTVIFVALSLATFWGVKLVLQRNTGSAQSVATPSLIFAENTFALPQETRTGDDLKRTLVAQTRSVSNIPPGTIIRIVPTSPQTNENGTAREQAQSIGDFLVALEAQATPELIRSFRGDFFLGLHRTAEKLSPVLIIPVTSYERAFAGMLAWEPSMSGDLSPIFSFTPPRIVDENGLFVDRKFGDTLINNYDARVLKDDSGAIQLMYSFPTRTILIISESPYSFTEALSRLRASRQL